MQLDTCNYYTRVVVVVTPFKNDQLPYELQLPNHHPMIFFNGEFPIPPIKKHPSESPKPPVIFSVPSQIYHPAKLPWTKDLDCARYGSCKPMTCKEETPPRWIAWLVWGVNFPYRVDPKYRYLECGNIKRLSS